MAKAKSKVNAAGNYTKPTMRKRLFNKIKAGTKGGNAGQWSARKAQMLAKAIQSCRWRIQVMALKKSQKSLLSWGKEDWGTKSGKASAKTGERYLPKAARESLSDSEYAATTAKKRKDTAAGKQHSKQPKKIADKTADYRDKYAKGGKADPRLKRAGVSGYNKPKRTPNHPKKSHVVVAKSGSTIKTIRFGEQGASTAGKPKAGESAKMKAKRKSFKARHAKTLPEECYLQHTGLTR